MDDLLRTAAVARLLLGPDMNIQVPPNLSDADFARLPEAGINDWGGVSPLTPDHINPERPWPGLAALRRATERAGLELRERLAVYPEYAARSEFVHEALRPRVRGLVDDRRPRERRPRKVANVELSGTTETSGIALDWVDERRAPHPRRRPRGPRADRGRRHPPHRGAAAASSTR